MVEPVSCPICGLAVLDVPTHDAWHDETDGKVRLRHPAIDEEVRVTPLAQHFFEEKGWVRVIN